VNLRAAAPTGRRRVVGPAILFGAAVVVTAVAAVLLLRSRTPAPSIGAGVATASVAPTVSSSPATPEARKLVGRWLRSDSEYTIEILDVAPDGRVEARYFNPQPIHVSRAEAKPQHGRLALFVELTDRGYPGSYYTLTYDDQGDTLEGVYHHLGLREDFAVGFFRLDEDSTNAAAPR